MNNNSKIQAEDILAMLQSGTRIYSSYGYTTAQEGRATETIYKVIKEGGAKGYLPIDVAVYMDYSKESQKIIKDEHSKNYSVII